MSRRTEPKSIDPACDSCQKKRCEEGKDCFGNREPILNKYTEDDLRIAHVASRIEAEHYLQKTRLEEVILFSREMDYKKLGIAFCIGLAEEAKILGNFLRRHFDVAAVCCKACGISKETLDLAEIDPEHPESMCNPIGQAVILNDAQTDLNLICGLCIGHDILFAKHSTAPVSTFIVKDRVLAHNPAASLMNRYLRKRFEQTM